MPTPTLLYMKTSALQIKLCYNLRMFLNTNISKRYNVHMQILIHFRPFLEMLKKLGIQILLNYNLTAI